MSNYSSASFGMALLAVSSLAFQGIVVFNKVLGDMKWPFFRIMAIVNAIASCVAVCMLVYTKAQVPEVRVRKWIVLFGSFGAITFMAVMLAVRFGAPPGDVSALQSVNIVVAALVAFMVLREPLHKAHGVSVICALAGVALIAKPEFIFGQSSNGGSPMLGYSFAIGAGFSQAGVFICSRLAGEISLWYHALSAGIMQALVCAVLPYTSVVEDYTMQPFVDSLGVALIVNCGSFLVNFMALILLSAGSQLCPAAVSATLNTASHMTFGYLAQIVVFHEKPDALALVGAALMLVAVFVIALLQMSRPRRSNSFSEQTATQPPAELDLQEIVANSDANAGNSVSSHGEDGNESIASFVASEFICFGAPGEPESSSQVRHRTNRNIAMSDVKTQAHLGIGSQMFVDAQIVGSVVL